MKLELFGTFSKSPGMSNFDEDSPLGVELFHILGQTDRQTDRQDKGNSRFAQFCEPPLETTTSHVFSHWSKQHS
jgi:hypothetical protein